jgi:hypothetical protein
MAGKVPAPPYPSGPDCRRQLEVSPRAPVNRLHTGPSSVIQRLNSTRPIGLCSPPAASNFCHVAAS